jgi:hypothetical protein
MREHNITRSKTKQNEQKNEQRRTSFNRRIKKVKRENEANRISRLSINQIEASQDPETSIQKRRMISRSDISNTSLDQALAPVDRPHIIIL